MRSLRSRFSLLLAILVLSPISRAATYIVPEDRDMIRDSAAILIGTVMDVYPRRARNGMIETITRVVVEERIKGLDGATTVEVANFGGRLGDERMIVSGAPVFVRGERLLLFLDHNSAGEWTTYGLALGVFRFECHPNGPALLSRGTEEIFGWSVDGEIHHERPRLELEFLDYIRMQTCGADTSPSYYAAAKPLFSTQAQTSFTSRSYALADGLRRNAGGLTIPWRLAGDVAGHDLIGAVDAGVAAWNAQNQLIRHSRSGAPATGNTSIADGENRIIASDPHRVVQGTCCVAGPIAVTMPYLNGSRHTFNGQSFATIIESDIVVNDGLTASNLSREKFETAITHELGHALGLRHSDFDGASEVPCAPPLDCCSNTNDGGHCRTVMNSAVVAGITGLQPWDERAIDCLYGAVCTFDIACNPASIVGQPQNRLLDSGASALLTVMVEGTPPLTPQWYVGVAGDTSTPAGTDWELRVSPTSTTSYWLRVAGACGEPANSDTATVTVQPCPQVVVTSAWASNGLGNQITLTAEATGGSNMRYRWYRGTTPGTGGTLIASVSEVTVSVTERTSFWVSVENRCGNTAVSELVFAAPCGLPSLVTQPSDQTIPSGSNVTLSLGLGDTGGDVTWYRGLPENKSDLVGSGSNLSVGPLTETTSFWASIANSCGEISTRAVTVRTGVNRRRAVRH